MIFIAAADPFMKPEFVEDENIEVIEGKTNDTRCVLLKFKDKDEAKRWYNSPEYQAVVGLRLAVTAEQQRIWTEIRKEMRKADSGERVL